MPMSQGAVEQLQECGLADSDEESSGEADVYPFHHSNIAEQTLAAYIVRAVPMMMFLTTIICTLIGIFILPVLLWTCAVLNTLMWVWIVPYALFSLQASCAQRKAIARAAASEADQEAATGKDATEEGVVHLVMLPNYKEDDFILLKTLAALKQARGSKSFRVMLAMEEREGSAAKERAGRMKDHFKGSFAHFSVAYHPLELWQEHIDGTDGPEIPGKSSNLKWATQQAFKECAADSISLDRVLLTVGDADCIFHPSYFEQAGEEFDQLRTDDEEGALWTMWQAPQFPFRNYMASPAPSRIWGYVSSVYENGGAGGLQCFGYHMTFSSFSIPLELVKKADPWDGDVIADDHHNYLKCFLYSVYQRIVQQTEEDKFRGINPPLVLRPIMLPVKSTSVEAETCKASWKARFNQAQRHTQGVAEMSYILLGAWRLIGTLPCCSYSLCLLFKLLRVVLLPICINMLPICQAIPFAAQTVIWLLNGQQFPQCPTEGDESLYYAVDRLPFYACWLAGGLNLVWPVVIPYALVMLASFVMISVAYVGPAEDTEDSGEDESDKKSIWHSMDGGIPAICGSKRLTVLGLVILDLVILFPVVMAVYGVVPAVMAYWNCMVRGNNFDFKSAAKGKKHDGESDSEGSSDEDAPRGVKSGRNVNWGSSRPARS